MEGVSAMSFRASMASGLICLITSFIAFCSSVMRSSGVSACSASACSVSPSGSSAPSPSPKGESPPVGNFSRAISAVLISALCFSLSLCFLRFFFFLTTPSPVSCSSSSSDSAVFGGSAGSWGGIEVVVGAGIDEAWVESCPPKEGKSSGVWALAAKSNPRTGPRTGRRAWRTRSAMGRWRSFSAPGRSCRSYRSGTVSCRSCCLVARTRELPWTIQ